MARVIAVNLLVFMVPFAVYFGWVYVRNGRVAGAGDWPVRVVGNLTALGAVLMILAIVVFVHFDAAPPGSTYVPAVYVDGELIPGHFE